MQDRMEQADQRFKEAMEPLSAMYRSLIVAHGLQRDEMDEQRMQLLGMQQKVFVLEQEVQTLKRRRRAEAAIQTLQPAELAVAQADAEIGGWPLPPPRPPAPRLRSEP